MDGAEIVQGTPEWRALKAGRVSASRISAVLAKGEGRTRAAYMAELVVERLTGVFTEGFDNADMRRGREMEPLARASYEFTRGVEVELVGFVHHPRIAMAGASWDGRVGAHGLVQFKCPTPHVHLEYLEGSTLPKAYRDQIQFELSCDDALEWSDFVSFCPAFPEGMDLYRRRIPRDPVAIALMEPEVVAFNEELAAKVANLRARYGQMEVA